ncbi:MAG TPA: tetratricopeptide repeat protein [Myxococcaceae bacterium]|nr:tetratricopeptide repeat protein [Myxococcaceae bacterium]
MSASRLLALLLAVASLAAPGPARADAPPPVAAAPSLSSRLEQSSVQLEAAEQGLRFIETQFLERPEPSDEEARRRRFSDGEIQYLLGNWSSASVLFYDLLSDPRFRAHPRYADALFYLGDSLYQQQNHIGARLYLRELLELPGNPSRFRDALARYLEIASRIHPSSGLDGYIQRARSMSGGELPPELEYAYAKWLFHRKELPDAERRARAREAFTPLASATGGRFQRQSAYFLGVLKVQEGDYAGAVEQFRALLAGTTEEPARKRLEELANLSLGRLLYELGRYDEALDRYGTIPRDSESFVESLYEVAWVYAKKEDFEEAKNATDILLLMAPDSPLAPQARLLQGHLLRELRRHDEAIATYEGLVDTFAPVRDQVAALLRVNQDPIAYFDNLLARNERTLDVTTLLPPLALRYASTREEVAHAVGMVKDLETSRQGVDEARTIAARILQALDERALEVFPELQEGYLKAEAVDSALARVEQELVQVEEEALRERLGPEEQARLEALRREREALHERFSSLPATQEELDARRQRMKARVEALDREAFRLGQELRSMRATTTAVRKWVEDTRQQRGNTPEEEQAFLAQLASEEESVEALLLELRRLRARMEDERHASGTLVSGEELIRDRYREALGSEHALLAAAEPRVSGEEAGLVSRAHEARARAEALRARVVKAKGVLRAQVERRGKLIRDKVLAEQRLLQAYGDEVATVSNDARHLVGRIAYEGFQRVHQQFHELVLEADVGLVDVAFTRKQDKTEQIQQLSARKDSELRALEAEFEEVLRDAE